MARLTPKQELFAQTYIKTGNASEAYRTAYDVKTKNINTINVKACELLKESKINARVKELQQQLEEKHDISKDMVIRRLKDIIFEQEQLGVDKVDLNAMNKAIDTLNKMQGYYEAKKVELSGEAITRIINVNPTKVKS